MKYVIQSTSVENVAIHYVIAQQKDNRPWVLYILPFGMELEFAAPFLDFFTPHFNVVTWEARQIIDEQNIDDSVIDLVTERHARDALHLMNVCNIEHATLVGYCSGAGIALLAANMAPTRFLHLILVHGEYTLFDHAVAITQFGRDIDSLLTLAVQDQDKATLLANKLAVQNSNNRTAGGNNDLSRATEKPFSNPRFLWRLALNYCHYKQVPFKSLAESLTQPIHILTGNCDEQTNMASSQIIYHHCDNGSLIVTEQADHYGLLRQESDTLVEIWNAIVTQSMWHPRTIGASA